MDHQTPFATANSLTPPQYFGTPKFDIPKVIRTCSHPRDHSTQLQYDDAEWSDPTTCLRFPYTPPVEHTLPTRFHLPQSTSSSVNTTVSATEQLRHIHDIGELIEDLDQHIERKVLALNKTMGDEDAVQQVVFHLITRTRLGVKVMNTLRRMNALPALLLANLGRKISYFFFADEMEVCLPPIPQSAHKTQQRPQPHPPVLPPKVSSTNETL
jgi:hypothetical protein